MSPLCRDHRRDVAVLHGVRAAKVREPQRTVRIEEGRTGVKVGKGFREWPGDRAERIKERRDRELIRWLKVDKEQGNE